MTNEHTIAAQLAYKALIADLVALEERLKGRFDGRPYLCDENIDMENAIDAGDVYGSCAFWETCLRSAASAAGDRGEELGLDINALIGRTIY